MIINKWHALALFSVVGLPIQAFAEHDGQLTVTAVRGDQLSSYQRKGIGLYRYDQEHDGVVISQAMLSSRFELNSDWSAHTVLNAHPDPELSVGFTQAYLQYQPLTASRYKWAVKAGGFYPKMSLENPQSGWMSPYNYTNSAINTWIGEEVRAFGLEASIKRPGRQFRSNHSFEGVASVFKGNDPAGTLLSWRGFAMHDRQTTFNERIDFATPNSFNWYQLSKQAEHVEPFEEVDGRFGYYVGAHWDYQKRSQLRVYYYDNNGDPGALNTDTGQYAWDTRFLSVAWLYKVNKQTRIIAQLLDGKTSMGPHRGVDNDFYSHFVLLSHKLDQHRLTIRYDYFKVSDHDDWQFDPNQSRGEALTASWRYQLSTQWQVGAEYSVLSSDAQNRPGMGFNEHNSQQQLQFSASCFF
ncbi:hypothetical protein [Pseudoalteromonas sp. SCSIO 43101]|uniref:hypothetical protein n=1 Tax=Pseudoalteromonas sp. SCSIO 43101 TaxID=2822847 RepID=UPI00202B0571|nr:hypothetical protein [Pseudoalteromonas sp. SCSIO 43101]URQ90604.1 hypothetical protein J8Z25_00975 [Pseudoalteromonas sp. SCSIO 43101]